MDARSSVAGSAVTEMAGSGVRVAGLTVELGGRTVLDSLAVEVERGELVTVLGNSGCGKTTLLRYIAGFVTAKQGEVWIAGRNVTEVPPHRRNIGLLYQSYALFPHMTVFENVAFGLRARGTPSAEIRTRVAAALTSVRMSEYEAYRPAQLSGGMQQRIALARALVIKPDILLLDEPVSALDANLRSAVRTEIKLLHQAMPELTLIYVTHDREDALVLSDRVMLLREGRVAQIGTPHELYDRPRDRFVANYLGISNFLPASVVVKSLPAMAHSHHGAAGAFCVRPECLRLDDQGPGLLQGEVLRSEWYGSAVRLAVRLDGDAVDPVLVETPRRGRLPVPGERVSLSFTAEDCVFVRD